MSRRAVLRKRILPIGFILAMGLLVHQTCQKQERTHATIVLDYGDAEARVRSVDAQLLVNGEVIGAFHRRALPELRIGRSAFEVAMPSPDGELRIDVDLGTTQRKLVRKLHATEGGTVNVPLASDLR